MKKNSHKIELVLLLVFSLTLLGTTAIFGSEKNLIKEKSIPTQKGLTLSVEASGADIYVQTWDKDEAYVKIYGNRKAEEKMRFEIEKVDDGINIIAKKKSSSWFNFWNWGGYDVKIEVMLPSNYNTDVETSGGDIVIANLKGKNSLRTSGGDVTLNSTLGDLYVETSGGDIKLNNHSGNSQLSTSGGDITTLKMKGDLKASTSGGDINLEVSDGRIKTKTSGGDIDIVYDGMNKGIEATTSGGTIRAKVPATFKANVYFETSGGEIESNFDNSRTNKVSRNTLKAEFNGGGDSFVLKTSGGDIKVDQR